MPVRKDMRAIHIRCEPEFIEDVQTEADKLFEGNVARFSRDAIKTTVRLRRELGPRYELAIAELLEKEPVAA